MSSQFLRLTELGQLDARGLRRLRLDLVKDGLLMDWVGAVSGQPGEDRQKLRRAADCTPGAMEMIGEGVYRIGDADSVHAENRRPDGSDWGPGLGPGWFGLHPEAGSGPERAQGIHLDTGAPGTAACVGLLTPADLAKVESWFAGDTWPDRLIVDLGLGSLPPEAQTSPSSPPQAQTDEDWAKLYLNEGRARAFRGGERAAMEIILRREATGALHVVLDGQEVRAESVRCEILLSVGKKGKPGLVDPRAALADPDSAICVAIGCAEGTRTQAGGRTGAYYGHLDPGNRARNQGTFSYQGSEATSAAHADQIWTARMVERLLPNYLQACRLAHVEPGTPLLLASAADLYTQSPAACLLEGGLLDRLPGLVSSGLSVPALVAARVESYRDPHSGELQAAGFGGSLERLRADQERRTLALADCLRAAGLVTSR